MSVLAFPNPLTDAGRIAAARGALHQIQTAVTLALRVLDSEEAFGTALVLEGVDDILAALVRLVV